MTLFIRCFNELFVNNELKNDKCNRLYITTVVLLVAAAVNLGGLTILRFILSLRSPQHTIPMQPTASPPPPEVFYFEEDEPALEAPWVRITAQQDESTFLVTPTELHPIPTVCLVTPTPVRPKKKHKEESWIDPKNILDYKRTHENHLLTKKKKKDH